MLVQLAAFVVVVAGIIAAKSLLIPFLLAGFLAIICAPPLYWLRKKKVPSGLSVTLLLLGVIVLQLGLTTLVGSSLADFSRALPQYQDSFQLLVSEGIIRLEGLGFNITDELIMEQVNPGKLMAIVAGMLNNLLSMLKDTFIILLTFLFIMLEAAGFPQKLQAMAGGSRKGLERYGAIMQGVNRYLFLKTLTSLATGLVVVVSLQLIGVDFAVLWGLVAVLLNFVPTIGSIIAAVPPVLLAVVQLGFGPATTTALVYLLVNLTIGNFLEPRIMGKGVGLSTLVIFLSLAFWGWALGPIGMLLSVPLTMSLKIGLTARESTRGWALLLGSNADAAAALAAAPQKEKE
ncbi:AI-2E family transporter [Desulfogranum mediterraneum]|uniref:AI-2E family transporter n=1 Tax=Desulfogranum mediterraneum TaxID=160661 RepID=UPI00040C935B|nr:AI-2E family transporter [Desulfogranum mediterraneum]